MSSDIAKARQEGMTAYGKTWQDCPYGSREQSLRDAWCAGRQEAIRQELQQMRLERESSSAPVEKMASLAIILVLVLTAVLCIYEVERLVLSRLAEVGHSLTP